jgi:hypothetical protein
VALGLFSPGIERISLSGTILLAAAVWLDKTCEECHGQAVVGYLAPAIRNRGRRILMIVSQAFLR